MNNVEQNTLLKRSKSIGGLQKIMKAGKTIKNEGDKLLNPDEYFKSIICNTLKIPQSKIHQNYFKDFLKNRNDAFTKFIDQKEKKEINFLKTLLKLKKRELIFPSKIKSGTNEIIHQERVNVAFKLKMAENLMNKKLQKEFLKTTSKSSSARSINMKSLLASRSKTNEKTPKDINMNLLKMEGIRTDGKNV